MGSSWNDYVENLKGGGCQLAGIFGQDGNVWGSNFTPTADEVKNIVGLMKGTYKVPDEGPGITLEGKKYTVLQIDKDDMLKLKRKSDETDDSKKYLFVFNLASTSVVCGAACGSSERSIANAVGNLRDYLIKNNF